GDVTSGASAHAGAWSDQVALYGYGAGDLKVTVGTHVAPVPSKRWRGRAGQTGGVVAVGPRGALELESTAPGVGRKRGVSVSRHFWRLDRRRDLHRRGARAGQAAVPSDLPRLHNNRHAAVRREPLHGDERR